MTPEGMVVELSMWISYAVLAYVLLSRTLGRLLLAFLLLTGGYFLTGHEVLPIWETAALRNLISPLVLAADATGDTFGLGLPGRIQVSIPLVLAGSALLSTCIPWSRPTPQYQCPFYRKGVINGANRCEPESTDSTHRAA